MDKRNSTTFLKCGLVYFAILFFLPLLNCPYAYADKEIGISKEGEDYRTKGYEAQHIGDIDTAIEWYHKACGVKPEYASPHNDLGILFETKGWLDRAEAEYQKALIIDPEYKEVHTNLALLYERKGELEKAAFHWMRRYKLGNPNDPWTQEAMKRLEKLGLLDKTKSPDTPKIEQRIEQQPPDGKIQKKIQKNKKKPAITDKKSVIDKPVAKKQKAKPHQKLKKESSWTKIGSEKNKKPDNVSKPDSNMDRELQDSLRMAEERLKKERDVKESDRKIEVPAVKSASGGEAIAVVYGKAKDHYNKGEYAKALDIIRIAKQNSGENRQLSELEDEIKFKMKEGRIEDYYKEGMIHYRQKDFAGARKEFEAILSILPE
jgi:tetratricopeptide (TPR) repeat protein